MNFDIFSDSTKRFSIVLFVQADDFKSKRGDVEQLGARPNVKLVVQPCPFEGIEFLYRVAVELPGQLISADHDVYWHALRLKAETPEAEFLKITEQHYDYLLAILEQDAKKVTRVRKALQSLTQKHLAS